MERREALAAKWQELGPFLQRKFWRPLRNMMEIFHVLPLAAAVILFVLLATNGQFREIYIAYLEGPNGHTAQWITSFVAAAAMLAMISAVLSEAHYSLSSMRINVVYSAYSNPEANSTLRSLQRTAAFMLGFFPWLGVAIGLFNARNFVAYRYCTLQSQMHLAELHQKQHLLLPGGWTIATSVILLGIAVATFCSAVQKTQTAQRAVALIAPGLGALLFLLFTDRLVPSLKDTWAIVLCFITALITIIYFIGYQWLYRRQAGYIFARPPTGSAYGSDLDSGLVGQTSLVQQLASAPLRLLWLLSAQRELATGVSLRKRRRHTLIIWAFAPWFCLALYFAVVQQFFAPSEQLTDDWSNCPISAALPPVPGHWAIFPVAMCYTIAIGLLVGLLLNTLSEQWMLRRISIVALVGLLALAALVVSRLPVDTIVGFYRYFGPLGSASLQLLFLIALFAALAWLSQRSGFPALTLVILGMVVCVMFPDYVGSAVIVLGVICAAFAVAAFLSNLRVVGCVALVVPILGFVQWRELDTADTVTQNQSAVEVGAIDPLTVKFLYECWLAQRDIPFNDPIAADQLNLTCPKKPVRTGNIFKRGNNAPKYPVYIIAAEGGGIYAASAASMFLARLQDASPDFGKHVFAISGVSGGAIGSTVFQALDDAASAQVNAAQPDGILTQKVTEIMGDDHLSPVVGSIFPEILGAPRGRAETLVASFEASASTYESAAAQLLRSPFAQHWDYRKDAPALLLNSTWVEMGYRVVFAPFHLHNLNESLYSFTDKDMPNEGCPTNSAEGKGKCISLMEAAAVSARFPLVLPPFSVAMTDHKTWNFVDGGYTDNSGATTAMDLYRILKSISADIDLRLILITSSIPEPNLRTTAISGTLFRDTMAPIDALMKVREDLGNDAVARACSEVYPQDVELESTHAPSARPTPGAPSGNQSEANAPCASHAGDVDAKLQIIEIQDQTYGLSLGWKISQTSFSVVSWMLGQPQRCREEQQLPDGHLPGSAKDDQALEHQNNEQLTSTIVKRNSCVMKLVLDLVQQWETPAPLPRGKS